MQAFQINKQRSQNNDLFLQIAAFYYLGRLSLKLNLDTGSAVEYLSRGLALYESHQKNFLNVLTFQYQILVQKIQKQLDRYNFLKDFSCRIEESRLSSQGRDAPQVKNRANPSLEEQVAQLQKLSLCKFYERN